MEQTPVEITSTTGWPQTLMKYTLPQNLKIFPDHFFLVRKEIRYKWITWDYGPHQNSWRLHRHFCCMLNELSSLSISVTTCKIFHFIYNLTQGVTFYFIPSYYLSRFLPHVKISLTRPDRNDSCIRILHSHTRYILRPPSRKEGLPSTFFYDFSFISFFSVLQLHRLVLVTYPSVYCVHLYVAPVRYTSNFHQHFLNRKSESDYPSGVPDTSQPVDVSNSFRGSTESEDCGWRSSTQRFWWDSKSFSDFTEGLEWFSIICVSIPNSVVPYI